MFLRKVRNKLGKILVQKFPLNLGRVFFMKKFLRCKVGELVYLGPELLIASLNSEKSLNLEIGNRVAIGPRVTLLLSSDANYSILNNYYKPIRGKIIIEDDVWIGASVTILPNVKIGKASIIGAGSVVTKDIEPYTVNYGVPCKKIKYLNIL